MHLKEIVVRRPDGGRQGVRGGEEGRRAIPGIPS